MNPYFIAAGQAFLAVLLFVQLGLTGYATSLGNGLELEEKTPPIWILFALGNTVWSIMALAFISITPLVLSYALHNLVALLLLAVTTIVWLGGSIAVASILGDLFENRKGLYMVSRPIVAFSFFIWVTFATLMSVEVVGLLKSAYRNGEQGMMELRELNQNERGSALR
ncbi:hypothetical protein ED733_007502 [Metarhizium rileyi]|uniref:MARVEL domain-containing protein n=1 Tax=Metarhizium rileyi (strain RCEF 4871) TaxID=1649241 RepID=A0A5C6GJM5_METRR|nr:hypothetical protein ED733_007502 [Metarhizium rileyi]